MDKRMIFFEGRIVPFQDARIHVLSPCLKYGLAVFEGIRGYWSEPRADVLLFRLGEHVRRLGASARILGLRGVPSQAEVEEAILATVRANGLREKVHIRAMVYPDGLGDVDTLDDARLVVTALPLPTHPRVERGVRARVSSWRRMADDAMPARAKVNGNYVNGRLAALEARRDGYEAAIMLNSRGKVAEGPTMCLFVVRRGVAVTPSVTSEILESITRETAMQLLRDELGVPVQEREVDRSELYDCEEAFFCGTGYEICPIREIDGIELPAPASGSVVVRLIEAYRRATLGLLEARQAWTDPVYVR